MSPPERLTDPGTLADTLIGRVDGKMVLGVPLGLAKPVGLLDALYARAKEDPGFELTILTALTLERPEVGTGLKGRFLGPILDRAFGGYRAPRYALDQGRDALPPNVTVTEFYVAPGSRLRSRQAQQSYASINYTHAARMVLSRGINVAAQLVRETPAGISLSCNPDVSLDLIGPDGPILVGQPHPGLPDMGGDARIAPELLDYLLDVAPEPLPSLPDQPVTDQSHMIGLTTSALVPDGGTLQIGIGGLGDAICAGLLMRERHNDTYRQLLGSAPDTPLFEAIGGLGRFEEGLFGCSEMLVEGMVALLQAGIIRRKARDGAHIHSGFFLGPRRLLEQLEEMTEEEREAIQMKPISFVNDIFHDFEGKAQDRKGARFLNTAMMLTMGGAAVSDGLQDGRVVSGVGGQFDFVVMGHALPDGRSVIMCPAVRGSGTDLHSNIRYAYGHCTVPRHMRDIVVTEYGVADLRGKTDAEVADAMLRVADARFVDSLRDQAVEYGKLPRSYQVPDRARANTPEALADRLAPVREHIHRFPFGTDWTPVEQNLLGALKALAEHQVPHARDLMKAVRRPETAEPYLERMGLAEPDGVRELGLQRLLLFGLAMADLI